jgi:hypothetical protein
VLTVGAGLAAVLAGCGRAGDTDTPAAATAPPAESSPVYMLTDYDSVGWDALWTTDLGPTFEEQTEVEVDVRPTTSTRCSATS